MWSLGLDSLFKWVLDHPVHPVTFHRSRTFLCASPICVFFCVSVFTASTPRPADALALSSSPVCPKRHSTVYRRHPREGDQQFSACAPGSTVLSPSPFSPARNRSRWLGRRGPPARAVLVGKSSTQNWHTYSGVPLGLRSWSLDIVRNYQRLPG